MSFGIVQEIFADVCPTVSGVAQDLSPAVKTPSRLKSIHAQRFAVSVTPAVVTGIVNVSPLRLSTNPLQEACVTPSSTITSPLDKFLAPTLISVPAATASPFVVE